MVNAVVDGEAGVIELRPVPGDAHLRMHVHLANVDGLIHVVEQARRISDLDADPLAIGRDLGRDTALGPLVRSRPGLRVPGAWDPFELGVRAILGQQVAVRAATTLAGRLVSRFGLRLPDGAHGGLDGGLAFVFPPPSSLADADLESVGLTRERAATVRGIGPWTAHYIAMRAGGERDAFPGADLGLRRALGGGRPITVRERERRAEFWRPWRAYAAVHLWAERARPLATRRP